MRIAVSATGPGIYDAVDPRLGRCAYFVIVDPEESEYEVLENCFREETSEAGVRAAELLAGLEVEIVVSGDIGPHALRVLNDAGIPVRTEAFTTVRDAIEDVLRHAPSAAPVAGTA